MTPEQLKESRRICKAAGRLWYSHHFEYMTDAQAKLIRHFTEVLPELLDAHEKALGEIQRQAELLKIFRCEFCDEVICQDDRRWSFDELRFAHQDCGP